MNDPFYKAFEDKYGGSRALIKSQLQVYLPYIKGIKDSYPEGSAVDLVCGKGEWLEILNESGFRTLGIDLDPLFIEFCKQRGLNVKCVDPLDALRELDDDSQVLISGFHLPERTAFNQLRELTKEAHRVLKPGGLLIFETPNPENTLVSSNEFYFDPRNQKQLSPDLLAFVPEFYGFSKIKIIKTNEKIDLVGAKVLSLHNALYGLSSQYAVVAQKSLLKGSCTFDIDSIESKPYVSLKSLTDSYDQNLQKYINDLKLSISEVLQVARDAEHLAIDAENKLNFIHRSLQWKLTRPLRWLDHQINLLKIHGPLGRVNAFGRRLMVSIVNRSFNYSVRRPKINRLGGSMIKKTGMYDWLCTFLVRPQVQTEIVILPPTLQEEQQAYKTNLRLSYMDQAAKKIYDTLSEEIKPNKGIES